MIAQMVGAGQLIKVLFGLEYIYAVILVGVIMMTVSYTHLRAHETVLDLVCRLLLEKQKKQQ